MSIKSKLAGVLVSLALFAQGQVIGTTNTLEHVSDYTMMWSLADPFGFSVLSNLQSQASQVSNAFVKISSGASTNQSLSNPYFPDKVRFNTDYPDSGTLAEGEVGYDPDNHTLAVGLGNGVVLQLGQELPIPVENRTGAVITNGMVVGFAGTVAASGRVLVRPFVADGSMMPDGFLGMVTSDDGSGGIANNGRGNVTWFGKVRGRDTTGAFDGEYWPSNGIPLYVSTNRPGFLTINKPNAPNPVITVGTIAYRSVNQGTVNVRPRWRCPITDLDDVDGTVPSVSGQILVYDAVRRVHDFSHNINSYATTGQVASVSNQLQTLSQNLNGLTYAWLTNYLTLLSLPTQRMESAYATAVAASNVAASAYVLAVVATNTAEQAFLEAWSASEDAAAAFSLASTYYAYSTNALATSTLAYVTSTNALAIAQAIRGQNEYPEAVWSALGSRTPTELPYHGRITVEGGTAFTATVHSVTWLTNTHWQTLGSPLLTNALTSATNELVGVGYNLGSPLQAPDDLIPYPLQPVSGASDSWEWNYAGSGLTNRYRITAVTNAGPSVTVYLSLTNRYTGYLYGTTNISASAYTNTSVFTMYPLIDGVTGTVTFSYWRQPPTTNDTVLVGLPQFGQLYNAFNIFYTDEWAPFADRTITINGSEGSLAYSNLVFDIEGGSVTASTVTNIARYEVGLGTQNLASVSSLYTLMATSKVYKVWATDDSWYTVSAGTCTYWQVSQGTNIVGDADFADGTQHYFYPDPVQWPQAGWTLTWEDDFNGFTGWVLRSPNDGYWTSVDLSIPQTYYWAVNATGSALMYYQAYTTTVTYVMQEERDIWLRSDQSTWQSTNGVMLTQAQFGQWISTNQYVGATCTNIARYEVGLATQGLASVASLYTLMATSQVTRLYANPSNWVEWISEGALASYSVTTRPGYTEISFSEDFEESVTHETLYPMVLRFPFTTNGWIGYYGDYMGVPVYYVESPGATATWTEGNPYTGNSIGFTYYTGYGESLATNITLYSFSDFWSRTDMSSWISTNRYVGATCTNVFNDLIAGACDIGGLVTALADRPTYTETTGIVTDAIAQIPEAQPTRWYSTTTNWLEWVGQEAREYITSPKAQLTYAKDFGTNGVVVAFSPVIVTPVSGDVQLDNGWVLTFNNVCSLHTPTDDAAWFGTSEAPYVLDERTGNAMGTAVIDISFLHGATTNLVSTKLFANKGQINGTNGLYFVDDNNSTATNYWLLFR